MHNIKAIQNTFDKDKTEGSLQASVSSLAELATHFERDGLDQSPKNYEVKLCTPDHSLH